MSGWQGVVATSRVDVMVRPRWRRSAIARTPDFSASASFARAVSEPERISKITTTLAGITLVGAGRDRDAPDGRHDLALRLARERLAEQHRFGGAGERVAPQQHRHGAGMAGFAEEFDVEIGLPDDRRDDAERLRCASPAPAPARYGLPHRRRLRSRA